MPSVSIHGRHVPVCVYGFDLLELEGRDLRELPLEQRRARLKALLTRSESDLIRFSEAFPTRGAHQPDQIVPGGTVGESG
jgi:bifunctional non-homologous end joining protein LigD